MKGVRPVDNPPNPWAKHSCDWLGEPPTQRLELFEEEAKSMVSENKSPDLSFRFTANPYRGCIHACAYCYARPTHQYWSFGAGTDFDRKIVVKTNAPEVLARELASPRFDGETLVMSGNTDCYQGLEGSYELTRRCVEVVVQRPGVRLSVITKGALVQRDVALFAELAREGRTEVTFSIAFDDGDVARAMDPWAPKPSRRFEAMRALADAGVPVAISVAPIIPGLNDQDLARLLTKAKEHGASRASMTCVYLSREVEEVFLTRVRETMPEKEGRIAAGLRDVRPGGVDEKRFGHRMVGEGPRWAVIERMFEVTTRRLGLNGEGPFGHRVGKLTKEPALVAASAPRTRQLKLFDG